MATLSATPEKNPPIKLMLLGYSGTGKTTAYASLSVDKLVDNKPAYKLFILDFDTKAEEMIRAALSALLKDKKISQSQHDEALSRCDVCVCKENTGIVPVAAAKGTVDKIGVVGQATAWTTAVKQLKTWSSSLDDQSILIVDSLTYAAKAAANWSMGANNKLNRELTWQDYQGPQQLIENLITICADCNSNAIITGHQNPVELYKNTGRLDDKGNAVEELMDTVVVPTSIGKAGSIKLPARFNHLLVVSDGISKDRRIWTKPAAGVTTKTPFFARCKEHYTISTGLAEYFALRV